MHGNASVMFGDNFTLEQALAECKQGRDKINGFIADILNQMKREAPQPKNMKTVLFPIVRDFNCVIDQSIVCDPYDPIVTTLFGKEQVTFLGCGSTIYDILVVAGCFESKGQARKNWQGIKEIPTGYSEIGPIGKGKLFLFIWNPSE
jgi:hypothetical protein